MRRTLDVRDSQSLTGARKINLTPIEYDDILGYRSNSSKHQILTSLLTIACENDWFIDITTDKQSPIKLSNRSNTEELVGVTFIPTTSFTVTPRDASVTIKCRKTLTTMFIDVTSIKRLHIDAVMDDDVGVRLSIRVTENALIIETQNSGDIDEIASVEKLEGIFDIFYEALRSEDRSKPSGFKIDIDAECPFIRGYKPAVRDRAVGLLSKAPSTIAEILDMGVVIYGRQDQAPVIYPVLEDKTSESVIESSKGT